MNGDPRPLRHLIGTVTTREWMTMVQLAATGLFRSSEAARMFCRRHKEDLVLGKKGRVLLVDKRSLDRLLEQRAKSA